MTFQRPFVYFTLYILLALFLPTTAHAAPQARLWSFWNSSDELNATQIDHTRWQEFLDRYVKEGEQGFNLVHYAAVNTSDKQKLDQYIADLSNITIRSYQKTEQFAYWVNLYNATTVQIILNHYPVKSITKVGSGLFSFGPWDEKHLTIEQQKVSLNDIEHTILRPIWKDKRIHYAVNCASMGCPQLSSKAFTSANTESELQKAEKAYVLHPRGFRIKGNVVVLSKIYDWYQIDFGTNAGDVVRSFMPYFPDEESQERLDSWLALPKDRQKVSYDYDWSLNTL